MNAMNKTLKAYSYFMSASKQASEYERSTMSLSIIISKNLEMEEKF
jgi:hypothetical protein